jgi:hypothetical protein
MSTNQKIIKILLVALNELVNGIHVKDLYLKLETHETALNSLWEKIQLENANEVNWSYEELKSQRNILCEILKELDSSEFETRMGFNQEDIFSALIEIKDRIDSIV